MSSKSPPTTSNMTKGHIADDEVMIVIPARLDSTRLPGKPLEPIGGVPMVVQVLMRAREAGFEGARIVVACAEQSIADAVTAAGGVAVLTDKAHPSGSDRIYEALLKADVEGKIKIVVNLQGDLPEVDGAILRPLVAALMQHERAAIATPVAPASADEVALEQVVKAVVAFPQDDNASGAVGRVLYFSRAPIPHGGTVGGGAVGGDFWHHIGIYAWRRNALERFVSLPASPLERAERLEQLRALEDGMEIVGLAVDRAPRGIDTHADLAAVRARFDKNRPSKA